MRRISFIHFFCGAALFMSACGDEDTTRTSSPADINAKNTSEAKSGAEDDAAIDDAPKADDLTVPPPRVPVEVANGVLEPILGPPLIPGGLVFGGGGGGTHSKSPPPKPSLRLEKRANVSSFRFGQEITFTIVLTNTVQEPLNNVVISDLLPGISALSCTLPHPVASLPADAVLTCTATYVATAADVRAGELENVATATGTTAKGAPFFARATATLTARPVVTDFGDARESYGSASHVVNALPTLRLGSLVDTEAAALFSANALGDDTNNVDDEEAVQEIIVVTGEATTVSVAVFNDTGSDATLVGWIDFNNNGSFDNPAERATLTVPSTGAIATVDLVFAAQTISADANSFSRFRLLPGDALANPNPSPTGQVFDGEVEDHAVSLIASVDFGDAPESLDMIPDAFNTTRASNGPRHAVLGYDAMNDDALLMIGQSIDIEADGTSSLANFDDSNGAVPDDEEGVATPISLGTNGDRQITVNTTNNTGGSAYLVAWLDLNFDGVFANTTAERKIISPIAAGYTSNDVTFSVPSQSGNTYARFRLFPGVAPTPTATEPSPDGFVFGGEVEDYPVALQD